MLLDSLSSTGSLLVARNTTFLILLGSLLELMFNLHSGSGMAKQIEVGTMNSAKDEVDVG